MPATKPTDWRNSPDVLAIIGPEFKTIDDMPDWIVKLCEAVGRAAAGSAGAPDTNWPRANEQDAKGGWTFDTNFIQRVADAVEALPEDEGRPSMELVEGVLRVLTTGAPPPADWIHEPLEEKLRQDSAITTALLGAQRDILRAMKSTEVPR